MNTNDSHKSPTIDDQAAVAASSKTAAQRAHDVAHCDGEAIQVKPANYPNSGSLVSFPHARKEDTSCRAMGNVLTSSNGSQRFVTAMPPKTSKIPEKEGMLTKGLSIDEPLYRAVLHQAQVESRSFSFIVRRAIERDLKTPVTPQLAVLPPATETARWNDELIPIQEVARRLKLTVKWVRVRARKPGDPLRAAKSRVGKQKPMHFVRSKIEELERKLSHAA